MSLSLSSLRSMIVDAFSLRKLTKERRVEVLWVDEANRLSKKSGMYIPTEDVVEVTSTSAKISMLNTPVLLNAKNRKTIIAFHNSAVAKSPFADKNNIDHLTSYHVEAITKGALLRDLVEGDYTMYLVSFIVGMGAASVLFSLLLVWVLS